MGLYPYIKHFAMNDQETNRTRGNGLSTWATEQTIRELYLKPFEMVVKGASGDVKYNDSEGKPQTTQIGLTGVMSSFNRIGATWTGGSEALMSNVLRGEWGFEGFAITDFNLYPYMYVDQAWAAHGTDLMLTFEGFKPVEDTDSAYAQSNIRNAMHNLLYTVANSNAVNGIAPGASLVYHPAGWEIAVPVSTIVLLVLILAALVWMVIRVRRHSTKPAVGSEPASA